MPMIPQQPPRAGRSCANCACFYELPHPKNPLERQGYCARHPAAVGTVRMQVPRIDKEGKPVLARLDGKTVMDSVEDIAWTHAPMHRSLICMDGWRPIGAFPGENRGQMRMRQAVEAIRPALEKAIESAPELETAGLTREMMRAVLAAICDAPAAANEQAAGKAPASLDS